VKPGSYGLAQVQVRQTDSAGQTSQSYKRFEAFTVDTKAKAPRLKLAQDTGSSRSDRYTSNGTVRVLKLETGATWEYSINGGSTWLQGLGTTFTVPAGTYAKGQVRVRQLDVAGNLSPAQASFAAFTVDTQARVPDLRLVHDSKVSGDRVTNNDDLRVLGLEAGASWNYSLDGGDTWVKGSGNTFSVPQGRYRTGQVQVRQTDLAGNVSEPLTNFPAFTVDTDAPASPTMALLEDTGVSDSDRITNQAGILVGGVEANATWQYSLNNGQTWTTDVGLGFLVPEGRYGNGQVRARQIDLAGNRSRAVTSFAAFTVDLTPPVAPDLVLAEDTGTPGDNITSNGTINVLRLESGATWQYSVNSGRTWVEGTGTSFVAAPGSYGVGQVQVRQTDVAGNQGPANTAFPPFTVESSIASLRFASLDFSVDSPDPIQGDVVTGTAANETFAWANLSETSLASYDTIVGYSSRDQISVASRQYGATLNRSVGQLEALTEANLIALLDQSALPASAAAAFTVAGLNGTFVALNDQRPSFQAATDGLVFLKDYAIGVGNTVTVV
jgi:hypothetical protein